jgi:hypothetical protein
MQREQTLAAHAGRAMVRAPGGGSSHPPAPMGQKRILIVISIRFLPHRIRTTMVSRMVPLRWRPCFGSKAGCPAFSGARRDRTAARQRHAVSSFRTHQAAIHAHRPIEPGNAEPKVNQAKEFGRRHSDIPKYAVRLNLNACVWRLSKVLLRMKMLVWFGHREVVAATPRPRWVRGGF